MSGRPAVDERWAPRLDRAQTKSQTQCVDRWHAQSSPWRWTPTPPAEPPRCWHGERDHAGAISQRLWPQCDVRGNRAAPGRGEALPQTGESWWPRFESDDRRARQLLPAAMLADPGAPRHPRSGRDDEVHGGTLSPAYAHTATRAAFELRDARLNLLDSDVAPSAQAAWLWGHAALALRH